MKKLKCTKCGGKNKFTYKTFFLEVSEGVKEMVTWCEDCIDGPVSTADGDKKLLEHISTPYWKLMGLKPKPHEVALEKQLKARGMTYGDHRLERSALAKNPSAYGEFAQHVNKYGTRGGPQEVGGYGKKNLGDK